MIKLQLEIEINPDHVPDWVKHIRVDDDGDVVGFEEVPEYDEDSGIWFSGGEYLYMRCDKKVKDVKVDL